MKEITGKYLSRRISYWLYTNPEFRKFIEENRSSWIHEQNPEQNKKDIANFVITNKRKPSAYSKDKTEKKLAKFMGSYCSPSSSCFDPEFKKLIDSYGYNYNNSEQNKKDIINFINTNKRKPSQCSKDKEEKRLYVLMRNYYKPSRDCFDPEFKKLIDSYGYGYNVLHNSEQNKKDIANFVITNKRKPSRYSKDKTEKRLNMCMRSYCSPSSDCFDPEFKKLIDSYGYNQDDLTKQNKKDIINFINTNKRKPSRYSKDKTEKKLAMFMGDYCSPSKCFDPEFKKLIDSYGYNNDPEQNKKDIVNFINTNKRKPSRYSKDKTEKRLNMCMRSYCSPSKCFDPEFKNKINQLLKDYQK